ncbi:hypothetical protein PHJA_001475000 [Phtheirospermum japonicum]|uniref:AT-hook motif nuclear-localized protein n=1 Tax=Phtheirospermum japonicum TaxID=374723 RepID=A0A830C2I6_9LAMI|nr:hypothetical protein PHJA_001475000 [Phtheirospermum japonicum]
METCVQLIILPGGHLSSGPQNMTPHIIIVAPGEDVIRKIMLFARGRHSTIILSCFGGISAVNMKFPCSDETVTYEGLFDIVNLSGSLNDANNAPYGLVGSLNLAMVGPDCNVIGGVVEDVMVAASPVQLIVATMSPKAPRTKNKMGRSPIASAGPADRMDGDFGSPGFVLP